jgi:ATP-dependent protease HslVU (ClpYQ) peptidase subunit
MTCIVGIETPDGVLLGADSIAADPATWTAATRAEAKLFRVGDYLFGFTTSFRMGDLLRYHLALPAAPKTRLHRHMVMGVVPAIRACLKEGGFATTKDGAEVGGEFLVGARGQLFHVSSDYQVGRSAHGYGAVGSGLQAALGALSATEEEEPRTRARKALEAAARHTLGVRGPWRFLAERAS